MLKLSLPPANEVCEGYVSIRVCQSFCSRGGGGSASVHAGIHPARSRDPQYMRSACCEIRTTSGRYASYWNAVLLDSTFSGSILFVCRGYIFCGFKGLTGLIGRSKGGARDAPSSRMFKFSQFHAVFGEILPNGVLAPPSPQGWRPYLGEILDPPQVSICPRGGGVCPIAYWDTPPGPEADSPGQKHPTPQADTRPGQTFPGQAPPGQTPPAQCLLGYGQQAGGTHPTGMHSRHSIGFLPKLGGWSVFLLRICGYWSIGASN